MCEDFLFEISPVNISVKNKLSRLVVKKNKNKSFRKSVTIGNEFSKKNLKLNLNQIYSVMILLARKQKRNIFVWNKENISICKQIGVSICSSFSQVVFSWSGTDLPIFFLLFSPSLLFLLRKPKGSLNKKQNKNFLFSFSRLCVRKFPLPFLFRICFCFVSLSAHLFTKNKNEKKKIPSNFFF